MPYANPEDKKRRDAEYASENGVHLNALAVKAKHARREANPEKARQVWRAERATHPEEARAATQRWKASNPGHQAAYRAGNPEAELRYQLKAHGLTIEQFKEMVEMQSGKCAICGNPPAGTKMEKRLHVDHDHQTGKVRSLLCGACNRAIGLLRDEPQRCDAMLPRAT